MSSKLLIVKPTALGDVAQTCLVVPVIKELHPDWLVAWVVDEDYIDVVRLCPNVDEVIGFPRKKWKRGLHPVEITRWFLELRKRRFDIVLDLQGLARSALMTWATRAARRIGLSSAREGARFAYTEKVRDEATHAVDRYRQAITHLTGKFSFSENYRLQKPPEPSEFNLSPGRYTVLHPYSIWETKLWPWERYNHLAESLPQETFVIVGNGPSFPFTASNVIDLRGQTTIKQLLSVLAHARAVISTDSGPAHLAAALERPTITIFGASDPRRTEPLPVKGQVLTGTVACRPCLKKTCRNSDVMKCMLEVEVQNVCEAWRRLV